MGKPLLSLPIGKDIAGIPAILAEIVNISERYMLIGSFSFSPILKAVVGDVGDIITSTFRKSYF